MRMKNSLSLLAGLTIAGFGVAAQAGVAPGSNCTATSENQAYVTYDGNISVFSSGLSVICPMERTTTSAQTLYPIITFNQATAGTVTCNAYARDQLGTLYSSATPTVAISTIAAKKQVSFKALSVPSYGYAYLMCTFTYGAAVYDYRF